MSAKDIERLAEAAQQLALGRETDEGGSFILSTKQSKRLVRAVLQALREPSEETTGAGIRAYSLSSATVPVTPIWQAMIDHLLAE